VKAKAKSLQLCTRISEGYSQSDLAELFGVSPPTIRRWIMRRWLTLADDRVCDKAVIRFLKNHPDQYSLRRINEEWFKGLIFPRFGGVALDVSSRDRSLRVARDIRSPEDSVWQMKEEEPQCA
jgi:hypothetical protein